VSLAFGRRRAMSAERLLSTMRSLSRLPRAQLLDAERSSGAAQAPMTNRFELGLTSLERDGLVAALGAFFQRGEVSFRGAFALRRAGRTGSFLASLKVNAALM